VVGEIEGLLEGAGGDTPVEDLNAFRVRVFLARNEERVLFLDEFDLVRRKARERQNDAVLVVPKSLDVIRRPGSRLSTR
jgi:hypothetical protein